MVGTNSLGIPGLSKSDLQWGMKIDPGVRPDFSLPEEVTRHKYPLDILGLLGLEEPGVLGTLHLEPAGGPAGVPGTWIDEKFMEVMLGTSEGEAVKEELLQAWMVQL